MKWEEERGQTQTGEVDLTYFNFAAEVKAVASHCPSTFFTELRVKGHSLPFMHTEYVLQVVLSHSVLFIVLKVYNYHYEDDHNGSYYHSSYNVWEYVGLNIHGKSYSGCPVLTADFTGVLPVMLKTDRFDCDNAVIEGGVAIWGDGPDVGGAGVSHRRAVQL